MRGITKTCLYGVHFVDLNKMVTFCHRFVVKAGFIHGTHFNEGCGYVVFFLGLLLHVFVASRRYYLLTPLLRLIWAWMRVVR